MDRKKAQEISNRLEQVLAREFPELTVTYKSGSYGDSYFTAKVEFAECSENGKTLSPEHSDLMRLHDRYGISQQMIDDGFFHPRLGTCKIVGLKVKASKYPVVVKTADGKKYKFSTRDVKFYANA